MSKHLLLTGASSGIGRELAVLAAEQGYRLSLCGRSADKLNSTLALLNTTDNVHSQAFCVTDESARTAFFHNAIAANGAVDVLINCAGLNNVRLKADVTSIEQLDWLMKVNCYAPIECIKAVLPGMKQQGCGTIINVLSTVCLFSNPGIAAYTASKAALDAYTKVMRKELAEQHIKMLSVYPGGVDTDFREASRPEYLSAKDVADAIMTMLSSTANAHIHELVIRPEAERNY
ncbi:SDR family NAD(P)-dependent oxidoreductase [Aestuariibacter sp. GS-14]|uniref:SDR family oxidoreductase n=1 Tax=Aestuariibacter sp. GS-14 TaxID=2590670 RepID=UPI00112B7489|nr:SDR family NAD(P)-dependent oxidoreductase [Aestuariibacter sp. GS-14]TPV53684.1 SDR family NAD(P)-dependent oxidoreductase [Aestuariibacter sp. GS-14]